MKVRRLAERFDSYRRTTSRTLIGPQCDVVSSTLFDAGDRLAGYAYGGWRAHFDEGRCMAPHDRTGSLTVKENGHDVRGRLPANGRCERDGGRISEDLAYAQPSPPQMYGYKRAAAAIASVEFQLPDLIAAEGRLPKIPGIGPRRRASSKRFSTPAYHLRSNARSIVVAAGQRSIADARCGITS